MTALLIFLCFAVLALGLWRISNKKSDATTLRWGVSLIFCGLFSSLYMYISETHPKAELADFLKNFFLIVASIGANFVASSALLNSTKIKK